MSDKPNQLPIGREDFKPLEKLVKDYVDTLASKGYEKDIEHQIYEKLMEILYGPEIWGWINK